MPKQNNTADRSANGKRNSVKRNYTYRKVNKKISQKQLKAQKMPILLSLLFSVV